MSHKYEKIDCFNYLKVIRITLQQFDLIFVCN